MAAGSLHHPSLHPLVIDLTDGLSPREAAVLAVLANPGLVAVRDAHGEAAAQLVAAGLLPNPSLEGERQRSHFIGGAPAGHASRLDLGLEVSALVGRSARVAAAQAHLDEVDLGIAWREWSVAQRAKLDAVRLGWLGLRLDLVRRQESLARSAADTLETAVARGDAELARAAAARSSLAELGAAAAELRRTALDTRSDLGQLLGLPPGTAVPLTPPGDPPSGAPPPPPAVGELAEKAIAERLDLQALRRGYDAEEAAVRQAVLAQFPKLTLGLTRETEEDVVRFPGGFVSFTLPIFDRAQGRIAQERATRRRLRDEYAARVAGVRADLGRFLATDRLLSHRLARLQPLAEQAADEAARTEAALARGDVDLLAAEAARRAAFELERQRLGLLQERAETRVALETAVGTELGDLSGGAP